MSMRSDHRIRLRVADIKNLFYNNVPQNLMDNGSEITCSLVIKENFDPEQVSQKLGDRRVSIMGKISQKA